MQPRLVPSIHDAYGGFGQKSQIHSTQQLSTKLVQFPPAPVLNQNKKYANDASYSSYPAQIKCPKCNCVSITRMQSQLGTASWLWCVLLAPFACVGVSCLFIQSCRDKIHYCNRCGHIVGKKYAKVC